MFRQHIDFFAVFFIAVVMIGFSQAASLRLPDAMDSVRLQNVTNAGSCPIQREVLSRIAYFLDR